MTGTATSCASHNAGRGAAASSRGGQSTRASGRTPGGSRKAAPAGHTGNVLPDISGQLLNTHFNQHPGEILALQRPIEGGFIQVPVNIISQNGTFFNAAAVQPVTPLLAIYQLAKIARADENIARAKVGMPVTEAARKVEKNYFDLLVAQRELVQLLRPWAAPPRSFRSMW